MKLDYCFGFTGTQEGMNGSQMERFQTFIVDIYPKLVYLGYRPVFRHGDCIGSDDQAARTAKWAGYWVIAHPTNIIGKRAYCPASDYGYEVLPPLVRNKIIVNQSNYLIATPKESEEEIRLKGEPLKSGTWSTIRFARKKGWKEGEQIYIIYA
jgi:hypothetical protein